MTPKTKRFFAAAIALAGVATTSAATTAGSGDSPKPKAYLVSDAHLDTQWNWDIQTTIGEYVWNTINQNLFLLKKYPEYVFNFEGGVKYSWMKEYYPLQYEEMKKFIKDGRWHICGASWDATDAIVPSVESAIRNIMLGQQFYRSEFGVESTDIFLPDCFGFGWTLPTIAKHCGLIGFSSQKLGWRHLPFHGDKKYPYTVGLWKGVDGSQIMMAHGFNYGQRWEIEDLTANSSISGRIKESPLNVAFHYYGTGDIGGSPTMNSVDAVCRATHTDGPIEIISAESDRLFKDYLPYEKHPELPVHDGELLMDVHGTGCYTSQAAMKLYNRQNELLGDAAERAAVAASMIGAAEYPSSSLTESWRRFIFHQFHDDLTGTSIPRAYEFSWNDELLSLKQFAGIITSSVSAVADRLDTRAKGTPVVLFNALGHEATDLVEMDIDAPRAPRSVDVYNAQGRKVASQLISHSDGKARILVEATVPANGYTVYDVRLSGTARNSSVNQSANTIENSVYRLTLDSNGDITSLFDKANNKELVKPGKAIRLAIFTDNKSYDWPAWEILKPTIDATPVSINGDVNMTLVEDGPLRRTLCVDKRHGDSRFRQYIRLNEGALADRIDFFNEVDWKTQNALVKAEFPLDLDNEKATYDLGIGCVERGNNTPTAYEVYAQRWADLTDKNGRYGATIMNDCKYGWDKPDNNTLRLTLLHTPAISRSYTYQDRQDLGYHTFTYSLCGHNGRLQKAEANAKADLLNQRIKAFATTKHNGTLGKSFSPLSTDNSNVAVKALKLAENSNEYVVRVYETSGKEPQNASLTFAKNITAAYEADGTEKTIGETPFSGSTLKFTIKPNSIKTFKVRLADTPAEKGNHRILPLDFNKKCFSWNEMRSDADFASGYSYAAELIPSELTVGRVPFKLENSALLNGMSCHGDTLTLPAGHGCNKLHILAAAATDDRSLSCDFKIGKSSQTITIPSYTGFIGQWGHDGHTKGYLTDAEVAYTGTHRHSSSGDHPYEFTYMFKFDLDIPAGATRVILPDNGNAVIFAATLANEANTPVSPLAPLFRTSIKETGANGNARFEEEKENILRPEHIVAWSGFVNDSEHPTMLVDNDLTTKWCDVTGIPAYVDFDLGAETEIGSWKMVNAAIEHRSYITSSCLVQVRNTPQEEWRTIDYYTGNSRNIVAKTLHQPEKARYIRLNVIHPVQAPDGHVARVYEFALYRP